MPANTVNTAPSVTPIPAAASSTAPYISFFRVTAGFPLLRVVEAPGAGVGAPGAGVGAPGAGVVVGMTG